MSLRPYQKLAVEGVYREWEDSNSTLVVLPTGCGKTRSFAEVVSLHYKETGTRSMVIAHREEIVEQNAKAISHWAGIHCEVEMADKRVYDGDLPFYHAKAISSSVQTLMRRVEKFNPMDFGLLVIDEAHHSTAKSWRDIIKYFRQNPKLKVLGVTATPDRSDEEALGQIFETVAFEYEIVTAIADGWLVPVDQGVVKIVSLDFSRVGTVAGDFNQGELAALLEDEQNTHGMASATLSIIGNRPTVVYAATVKQAELFCEILNRHRPGIAAFISGKTPKDERREILQRFSCGELQCVVNCGVLTEGWDAPVAEVIVLARPTKSRALYTQMVGRGLRPLPGLFNSDSTLQERQIAIAASKKPKAIVLDFEGNAGKHKLMTTADILGGKYSDEVIERAKKKASESTKMVDMTEALAEAHIEVEQQRDAERRKRSKLILTADYQKYNVSPFDLFHVEVGREKGYERGGKLSEKQRTLLQKQGFNPDSMSNTEAKALIGELTRRWNEKLCTFKQAAILKKHNIPGAEMLTMKEASALLDNLARNHWKHV